MGFYYAVPLLGPSLGPLSQFGKESDASEQTFADFFISFSLQSVVHLLLPSHGGLHSISSLPPAVFLSLVLISSSFLASFPPRQSRS